MLPVMDRLLQRWRSDPDVMENIARWDTQPARAARWADFPPQLHPRLKQALLKNGLQKLYIHQAQSWEVLQEGHNLVVVTGTASGKTLCYNLAVLDAQLKNPQTSALYIFPTKALTNDQKQSLVALAAGTRQDANDRSISISIYDGDTPRHERTQIRTHPGLLLTNPDMLHQGILPRHAHWNRVFSNLRYVVLDEVHSYRGVFGSHLANVLRRFRRVCAHYGSHPQFICCSATIGNPREHAERIVGEPMELVDRDGSPRGPKKFVFWNPPVLTGEKQISPSGRNDKKFADVILRSVSDEESQVKSDPSLKKCPLPGPLPSRERVLPGNAASMPGGTGR